MKGLLSPIGITAPICGLLAVGISSALAVGAPKAPPTKPATKTAVKPVASVAPTPPVLPNSGLLAPPTVEPIVGMSWPSLSPDGKQLCFTYRGNLWISSSTGGMARRLTVNVSLDSSPTWSPDGKFIAFTSLRTGSEQVFLIPEEGGTPRQVTHVAGSNRACEWSPDGTHLLVTSFGRDTRSLADFSINLNTLRVRQLTHDSQPDQFADYSPNGKDIVYSRAGQNWWRAWYRGSIAAQTMEENLATGKVKQVLQTDAQQYWPFYSATGKSVFITTIMGKQNTPNIWKVSLSSGDKKEITHYTTDAVRWPVMARNGSLICYLYDGHISTVKPDGDDEKELTIYAPTDSQTNNSVTKELTGQAEDYDLSKDGKTIALILRGQIWTIPVSGGDATRITDNIAHNADIAWSPDGTQLAYTSDVGNQPDLYTIDIKTKKVVRLTDDMAEESAPQWSPDGSMIVFAKAGAKAGIYVVPSNGSGTERLLALGNGNNNFGTGISSIGWSPDSKWVAYSRMDRYGVIDLWIVPAIGGTPIDVTRYPRFNGQPIFTADEKFLVFISDRGGSPGLYRLPLLKKGMEPKKGVVTIDFDGITDRAVAIPAPGPVEDFAVTPDGTRIVFLASGSYWVENVDGTNLMHIFGPVQGNGIEFTPHGHHFYYLDSGGVPQSLPVPPGPPASPTTVNFSAKYTFDTKVIELQAFNEFFRRYGAGYYDRNMNGVNWTALREKYEPMLRGVRTPFEFANLLSEVVGEVNSSHSEIGPQFSPSGPHTASLGLNYDYSYSGPGLKVTRVVPNGPCDQPKAKVNVGDYILSIDGTSTTMTEDYYKLLQDMAGKKVTLVVNTTPELKGSQTLTVKPVPDGAIGGLLHVAKLKARRELVSKLSGDKLGYIHIDAMDGPSLAVFQRYLFTTALRKEGLIIDIRHNGGGNTHNAVLQDLDKTIYMYTRPRDGEVETQPTRAYTRPLVLLIDQSSYSDAEIFPQGFKALHLGKVIGMPTPGYVIGTYEGTLLDGTHFRLPTWGYYTLHGRNLENMGVQPDIEVPRTPQDVIDHKDPQLEMAVKVLLGEIQGKPPIDSHPVLKSANTNPNGDSSAVFPGTGKD